MTSRRGGRGLWAESQKLRLEPLNLKDAMALLWRWRMGKPKEVGQDGQFFSDIDRLKHNNRNEYRALTELAGSERSLRLAGLPLGLFKTVSFRGYFKFTRQNGTL